MSKAEVVNTILYMQQVSGACAGTSHTSNGENWRIYTNFALKWCILSLPYIYFKNWLILQFHSQKTAIFSPQKG